MEEKQNLVLTGNEKGLKSISCLTGQGKSDCKGLYNISGHEEEDDVSEKWTCNQEMDESEIERFLYCFYA